MVAPLPIVSSSGCACTNMIRRAGRSAAMVTRPTLRGLPCDDREVEVTATAAFRDPPSTQVGPAEYPELAPRTKGFPGWRAARGDRRWRRRPGGLPPLVRPRGPRSTGCGSSTWRPARNAWSPTPAAIAGRPGRAPRRRAGAARAAAPDRPPASAPTRPTRRPGWPLLRSAAAWSSSTCIADAAARVRPTAARSSTRGPTRPGSGWPTSATACCGC